MGFISTSSMPAQDSPPNVHPRSDTRTIPAGKAYRLALRFNKKRHGLAAFDWVAIWRTRTGLASRAFPLEAHGFDEALRGAATIVHLETGVEVPRDELSIEGYKSKRVNEYLRQLALQRAIHAVNEAARRA
jgi:hypothetical protein